MPARLLYPRTSLLTLLGELRYTLSRLHATPKTAPFVATFQTLRDEWKTVLDKEISLQESLSDAQALIDAGDAGLDDFASRLSKAILTITKDDRTNPLYTHFFGDKSLSEFRRPNLGAQLQAMRPWADSLTTSPHPTLKAMAQEHAQLIAAADKAVSARDKARQQNRQLRDVGERRQFLDKLNAARKATHGALAKLAIETPGMPSDFADHFFRGETSGDRDEEEDQAPHTLESVKAAIADLEGQLKARRADLEKLEAEAKAAEAKAATQQADKAALDDLQQRMAEMAKQAEEIQKRLAKP